MREMTHVSKEGFAAADAQQYAIQRRPRCLSGAKEVSEGIVRRNCSEDTWHVAACIIAVFTIWDQACQST